MNCPHCQTANPSEAKFCMNCGKTLDITCSQCGKQNPPQAKFCINCGNPFSKTAGSPLEPARKYIPKAFAEKLESARQSQTMKGERRVVTVLFCDVKGSTAMAEKLDPEEWAEIINQAFEFLIAPIYKYEGTLARLMGDSVLAFFGAPIAHEDDAQRAVLAGLEILDGIQPFREKVKQRYQLDFNVRVGINTGLVVVGGVGSDLFMEYTALGDAINIAARMEQTARPGTIQIAEDTYNKISHLFEVEPVDGIEIKGKSEPVSVYRVLGSSETPINTRGIQGLYVPLVGRSTEFERLSAIINGVKKGRGQIVCLVGEAGLGKSRLLAEARQIWEASELGIEPFGKIESRWNQASCVSYESTRPYGLIQRLIKNFIGLSSSDSPESIRASLAEALAVTGMENSPEVLRAFETILGIRKYNHGNEPEGEELKRLIFKELRFSLDNLAQRGPTVIAIDDLQWADETSAEFISHLFQLANRAPILFICSFRPDRFSSAWKVRQTAESDYAHRYTEIKLSPLSNQDANSLIDRLFTDGRLPSGVREIILGKSEGNPFFMEEVIRTLIDNHVVSRDPDHDKLAVVSSIDRINIPDNLQALLVSRIDRLDEAAKHVLQVASVIGRTFYYQVLEIISGTADELDRQLNTLQRLGLILENAREPYLEYIFRQALTQETVYNTILLKHRKEFHRRVGETLEDMYRDRRGEFASIIGHHYYQAKDPRALAYYQLEGEAAFKLYANVEAIAHYGKAIEAAMWSDELDIEQLAELYNCRGRAYELNSQFIEAIENYREMEKFAQDFGDASVELAALIAQAQIRSVPSTEFDMESGLNLIEKAKTIAEEINDQLALAKIYWITTNIYRFSHGLSKAQVIGEKAIELARNLGQDEQLAYSLTDTAHTYSMDGKLSRAREVSMEAVEIWRKLNNQPMLADCLGGLASINVFSGDYDDAYRYSDEAYEISQRIENVWGQSYSRYAIGFVDLERGDIDLAIQHFNQSMADAQESNFFAGIILTHTLLSFLYSDLGHYPLAMDMVDRVVDIQHLTDNVLTNSFFLGAELLAHVRAGKLEEAEKLMAEEKVAADQVNFFARQYTQLAMGYLSLLKGDYPFAIQFTHEYLEQLQSNGIENLIPELLLLIARSQIALGEWHEADATLDRAQTKVEKLGSRRSQWQVDYLRGRCALHGGDQESAQKSFNRSKETLSYILDHISNDELREMFLKKEEVRAVFDAVSEVV